MNIVDIYVNIQNIRQIYKNIVNILRTFALKVVEVYRMPEFHRNRVNLVKHEFVLSFFVSINDEHHRHHHRQEKADYQHTDERSPDSLSEARGFNLLATTNANDGKMAHINQESAEQHEEEYYEHIGESRIAFAKNHRVFAVGTISEMLVAVACAYRIFAEIAFGSKREQVLVRAAACHQNTLAVSRKIVLLIAVLQSHTLVKKQIGIAKPFAENLAVKFDVNLHNHSRLDHNAEDAKIRLTAIIIIKVIEIGIWNHNAAFEQQGSEIFEATNRHAFVLEHKTVGISTNRHLSIVTLEVFL